MLVSPRLLMRYLAYTEAGSPSRVLPQTARDDDKQTKSRSGIKEMERGKSRRWTIIDTHTRYILFTHRDENRDEKRDEKRDSRARNRNGNEETKILPVWSASASACALADGYTTYRHTPSNATLPWSFHLGWRTGATQMQMRGRPQQRGRWESGAY